MDDLDAIVVGAGANGLACALVLARAGQRVRVLEDRPAVGGGCRTEFPFPAAPRLAASTGSHRLGFVPRQLLASLGVTLPMRPRDPCIFVPSSNGSNGGDGAYLLAGPGHEAFRAAVARLPRTGTRDAAALEAMHRELDAITSDLGPAWLAGALDVEATAERFVSKVHRDAFVALCRGSIGAYVDRFGIESDLVRSAIAADALASTFGSWATPGTGAAMLVRHAARSIDGGADAIPDGGMGAVIRVLAEAAQAAGAIIATGKRATRVVVEGNTAVGVQLADGEVLRALTVVCSADPARLRAMIGDAHLPVEYQRRIDGFERAGSVAKVNLALSALPRFEALGREAREPADHGEHGATIHLVPGAGQNGIATMTAAFEEAAAGRLPALAPLEIVFPTATDPALRDAEGRHHASVLVPWAPYDLSGTTWAAEEERLVKQVLDVIESFAPGSRALVVDVFALSPKKLESHFGVTRGHVHHVDDSLVFADRMAHATPIGGLYACGAGCSPAGGVFAIAGHNAAMRVLADMEMGLERTESGLK